jgi:hypothetical protein
LKTRKALKSQSKLKATCKAVPLQVKEDSIKLHGPRCYAGECRICNGQLITTNDDPDHFPAKGPHSTPDLPKYIFMAHRRCHRYYTDHPAERRELFQRIEAKGIPVFWEIEERKGIGTLFNKNIKGD